MAWEEPAVVEIDMNAEVGGYQADEERDTDEPILERDDAG